MSSRSSAFLVGAFFCGLCCLGGGALAQSAADLARLEKEMAARKEQAAQLDEAAKRQEAELDDLRQKAIDATRSLQESQEEQNKLKTKLAALEAESASRANALFVLRARLSKITGALVRLARQPPAFLAMRADAAPGYVRQSVLLREILPRLKAENDKLSGEVAYFDDLQSRVTEQKSLMVASSQNLQWQRHNLDQLVNARQGKLQKTKEEKEALQTQLAALAKEAKTLKQLLEKVTEASWSKTVGKSARGAIPALGAGLLHPVAGKVVRDFGQKDEFGVESEGVTYAPAKSAPIVAPQSGRVVFLGPFQGYGQVVIMQHQEGVHSFLAGFGRIDAELGQSVASGEPLGVMSGDEEKKSELYFEWRIDKKPVNPHKK